MFMKTQTNWHKNRKGNVPYEYKRKVPSEIM